jgi:hypothetical protein
MDLPALCNGIGVICLFLAGFLPVGFGVWSFRYDYIINDFIGGP